MMHLLLYSFLYTVYFGLVTSDKMFFSCISMSSLLCVQRHFSYWKRDSVVLDHLLQCNCTIDFDHFDVLATHVSKFNLLVKESLLIKRDNPVLNITK